MSPEQLVALLRARDNQKKLGLVWERVEIEPDRAGSAPFVACHLDQELSDKAAPWPHLIIEGDNLDALRWLRMTHANRVKCIYIDPPYNTGAKDWVYNDHYVDKTDRYRQSTWLEFLFTRLEIARDLLAPDGVMLISINDEQRARLELLCDEVMPGMRVGSLVWRTRSGGNEGGDRFLSDNHEHLLAYGGPLFSFGGTDKTFAAYANPDDDPLGDWTKSDLSVAVARDDRRAGSAFYPLHDPVADIWYPCNPDRVWAYVSRSGGSDATRIKTKYMEDWIAEGRVVFPEEQEVRRWDSVEAVEAAMAAGDVPTSGRTRLLREDVSDPRFWVGKRVGFGTPRLKRYRRFLATVQQPLSSWITPRAEADTVAPDTNTIVSGTNDEGAKVIKDVFGEKAFNYAKPVSLIRELIRQASGPDDLVLDFFAGSGTTAQAVMELNAEDGGRRRFILVSSTEATAAELDKNVCRDVTAERVRRLTARDEGRYADLAAPFAYLRTQPIAQEDLDYDLTAADVWTALEALHGLPLTRFDPALDWQEHESADATLVFVQRCGEGLAARLAQLKRRCPNLGIYAWAPGQVRAIAPDLTVLDARADLRRRFR